MSQMLKSSGAMGLATLVSRVLGMVREIVYANFMGDGPVASAFKMAFTIPNLFRRLLGEGALTAAFIPIFKDKEKNAGEVEMWRAANAVISGLVVVSAVIIGLVMLGVTLALSVHPFSENTRLMLSLLRLMFPYMLMICATAIFMGILNARGHFFIPAMGAAVLNAVMILSVLYIAPLWGKTLDKQIFGLAIGILIAGFAQAVFQLPNMQREGFRFQWVTPWKNETVREVVRKMLPGMLGVAAFQLNVTLTSAIAFNTDNSMVASFDYAVRLMELPQGVFGVSLATYLLTTLSGMAAEKNYSSFRTTLGQGMRHLIFLNVLASILLVILAEPIVRLIFERGQFGFYSTQRASEALACLAPGLVAFSLVNILARAFFALGDTQTPMKISAFCLVLNLVFVFFLVDSLRQAGLGIANTASSVFNVCLLLYALRRKIKRLELTEFRRVAILLLWAGAAAGIVAWLSHHYWEKYVGHTHFLTKAGAVFIPMILAAVVYFSIAWWMKISSAHDVLNMMLEKLRLKKRVS